MHRKDLRRTSRRAHAQGHPTRLRGWANHPPVAWLLRPGNATKTQLKRLDAALGIETGTEET